MKLHDLVQGSPEWLAYRREHFNASDAPAMMGCSPYKTRAALLHEMHTGIAPEADASTQRLYADGHRCEGLARPLAEEVLDDSLSPLVGSEGKFSASFDGLPFDYSVNWEHKRLNADLRSRLPAGQVGGPEVGAELPALYRVQMEQQMMVSGAGKTLFTASEWNANNELVDARHCWYLPDPALRERIVAGWAQFDADLAAYVPPEAASIITAAPQEHLPAVSVQLQGALAVVSNLAPFGVALKAFVGRIPKKPSTDQEFADTEAACKRLKEAEDALLSAESGALASMADVETMRRMVAEFREIARTARLSSEKLVTQRKQQIREEEVRRGADALAAHVKALHTRLGAPLLPMVQADFGGSIKGLKTLDSVRNAIDTELARAKIAANEVADRIDLNLRLIRETGSPHLFNDLGALVLKLPDDLAAVIAQRVSAERQRIEAERERIRTEEEAKARAAAEAAAAETARREQAAAAEAQRQGAAALETAQRRETPAPAVAGAAPSVQQPAPAPQVAAASVDIGSLETSEAGVIEPKTRIIFAGPEFEEEDYLGEAIALVEHIGAAFAGKFPSHPKPDQSWWTDLRARVDALRPKLEAAAAEVA